MWPLYQLGKQVMISSKGRDNRRYIYILRLNQTVPTEVAYGHLQSTLVLVIELGLFSDKV